MKRIEINGECGLLLIGELMGCREWTSKDSGEISYFAEINVGGLAPQSVRASANLARESLVSRVNKTVAVWVLPRAYGRDINLTAVAVQPVLEEQAVVAEESVA